MSTTVSKRRTVAGALAGLALVAGMTLAGAVPAQANAAMNNSTSLRTCQYEQRQMQKAGYKIYLSCHKISNSVWSFSYYYYP
jgi:hypothetical protein